jgi:hypothetical protein
MWAMLLAVWHHNQESENKIKTIACPGLGTATGGVSPQSAARQMSIAYRNFLSPPDAVSWPYATMRQGGGGAIDLVMHLEASGYRDAVRWLGNHFDMAATNAETLQTSSRCPATNGSGLPATVRKPPLAGGPATLRLPRRDDRKLHRVTRYLVHERSLNPALVQRLIASRTLYADGRANAVFLLLGKKNQPVGAELRGTSQIPWRGMAKGSRKEHGYFSVGDPQAKTIVLCEAAIDAISCSILIDDCLCISTAGARPNPAWLPSLLRPGNTIHCGFDADTTGDQMANAMTTLHPTIRRLRPTQHDWNDMLQAARR